MDRLVPDWPSLPTSGRLELLGWVREDRLTRKEGAKAKRARKQSYAEARKLLLNLPAEEAASLVREALS